MPTMADVAKRAGVAVSTVSYALSGARPVSERTRQRIMEAIAELGYHPNILARGLASKRTRIIALLFPSVARGLSQVQLEFVNAAAEIASQQGYALLLWTSPHEDGEILRLRKEGLIEGLLLMEVKLHDPRVETLKKLGYPFCMIGHTEHNDGISFVDFDFERAIQLCTQYLYELGHRNIAYLVYSPVPVELGYGPAVRSLKGAHAACEEMGLPLIVHVCEPDARTTYHATRELLEKHPLLTAVVYTSDVQYAGIMQAIRERRLRVPEDFSIVCIVSSRFAEMMTPPITAVDLPATEMGRIGTNLLIRCLEGDEKQPTQLILPPRLIVRQSTSIPRQCWVIPSG
ncbi:MAG: LacI family DNA-binding transcriptional regulator [Armatimonadota bacterium]